MKGQVSGQISIYDPSACVPVPPLHMCYETCIIFGENVDYPSWWDGKARCMLGSGEHLHSTIFENRVQVWCDLYKGKMVEGK